MGKDNILRQWIGDGPKETFPDGEDKEIREKEGVGRWRT